MTTTRNIAPIFTTIPADEATIGMVVNLPNGERGRVLLLEEALPGLPGLTFTRIFETLTGYKHVALPEEVEIVTCVQCAGQIADGHGGPSHYPSGTCRMGGTRAHCSCSGCY